MKRRVGIGAKLGAIGVAGLLAAVIVGWIGVSSGGRALDAGRVQGGLDDLAADMNFLDHRHSELKANGYHVLGLEGQELQDLLAEGEGDLQTIVDAWAQTYEDARKGEASPELMEALEAYEAASIEYADWVQGYTELAAVQPQRARAQQADVTDRNREMDDEVERVHELLEVQEEAAEAAVEDAATGGTRVIWLTVAVAALCVAAAAFVITRRITRDIHATVSTLDLVAAGDLTQRIDVKGRDEIGRRAEAMNGVLGKTAEALRTIHGSSESLASSSDALSATSSQMGASAEETSAQANAVSAAAEQVSTNIQTVATGAEEMSASIREIAASANEASGVAAEAGAAAQRTAES